jgi:hypothetical protein
MKECLQCKKEFDAKRDSAKYCSDNCRVKWNRKNAVKKDISPVQLQVLYNSLLEMVGKINTAALPPFFDAEPPKNLARTEPPIYQKAVIKIKRSFDYYKQARIACQTEEEWIDLKNEILNSDLSKTDKITLTT